MNNFTIYRYTPTDRSCARFTGKPVTILSSNMGLSGHCFKFYSLSISPVWHHARQCRNRAICESEGDTFVSPLCRLTVDAIGKIRNWQNAFSAHTDKKGWTYCLCSTLNHKSSSIKSIAASAANQCIREDRKKARISLLWISDWKVVQRIAYAVQGKQQHTAGRQPRTHSPHKKCRKIVLKRFCSSIVVGFVFMQSLACRTCVHGVKEDIHIARTVQVSECFELCAYANRCR